MKTGKCKYGATCKFHHPKDLQISLTGLENHSAEEAILGYNEFSSPALMHNTKGLPIRPVIFYVQDFAHFTKQIKLL